MKRAKPPKSKTTTLRTSDLQRIKSQCTDEAIETVLGMVYLTLHSQYGFGPKRLEKFRLEVERTGDYISQGIVSVSDIKEHMQKELRFDSRLWEVKG